MSRYPGPGSTYPYPAPSTGGASAYPAGWQPPFPGPPPLPPGMNINPQLWNGGYWQFNPAYQHRPPQAAHQAPWVASHQWGLQGQGGGGGAAGGSYNPYKKVPRQPSAEYWASKLSDNPLGLTNMIPREELYGNPEEESDVPHTPWVWNPRGLVEKDSEEGIITAEYRDAYGRRITQESRGPTPSRQSSSDRQPQSEPVPPLPSALRQTASSSHHQQQYQHQHHDTHNHQARHATDPLSSHHHRHEPAGPARHASEPPPQIYAPSLNDRTSIPSRRGSSSEPVYQAQQQSSSNSNGLPPLDRPLDRPKEYQRRQSESSPTQPDQSQPREVEGFTSKVDLQPTFPSTIIRTPIHYGHSPVRSSSTPSNSHVSPSVRNGVNNAAAQLTSKMDRMSLGSSNSSAPPLTRHSSMPPSFPSSTSPYNSLSAESSSSSLTDVSSFSEEPASMLSPLMIGTVPKPSNRSVSRGHSVPSIPVGPSSTLSSIPETSSPLNPNNYTHSGHNSASSSANPSPRRQNSSSRPSSRRTSPADIAHERRLTPPHSANTTGAYPVDQSYHTHQRQASYPYPSSSRLTNPLPPPPQEVRYPRSSPSKQQPPPAAYNRRVRKGFWNKRGDHLTSDGYIVYAPPDRAYPEDLKGYPAEPEGYRDELGTFAAFNERRPELPESLPRHGQPPARPYDSFLIYEYIP